MTTIAFRKKYAISEEVGAASLNEFFKIADPESGETLAVVEEQATTAQMIAKAFLDKAFLPVKLVMKNPAGGKILEISQPSSFLRSVFTVKNADQKTLCVFKQRFSFFRPGIDVIDGNGQKLGSLDGNLRFRSFQFKDNNGNVLATINHQYAGIARELFTTADDYEIDIHADSSMTLISLAAVICIDFIYHEN